MKNRLPHGPLAITCLTVACLLPTATPAQSIVDKTKKDEIVNVKKDDPAMLAAFSKARATLDDFLARQAAPAPGTDDYAVKIRMSENGHNEYFWIGDIKRSGDKFSGTLNNTPRLVTSVRAGQTLTFTRADIYDWTYVDNKNRRMMGNYTACALLTHEPPEAAAQFKRQYGLRCD